MWGLLVGIAVGGLQMLAVNKLGRMIMGGSSSAKLAGAVLFIVKIAAIIAILYLISTVSLVHLAWTAGGMLLGLLAVSFWMLKRRRKGDTGSYDNSGTLRDSNGDDGIK